MLTVMGYLFNLDSGVLYGVNTNGLAVTKLYIEGQNESAIIETIVAQYGEGKRILIGQTVNSFLANLRKRQFLPNNTRLIIPSNSAPPLLTVQLDLSWACNLHCKHCYLGNKELRDKPLTQKEWEDVIIQLVGMGVPKVAFLGGEPLLYPFFFNLAVFSVERGLRIYTTTNGTLITPEICQRFVDAGFTEIDVSLDGASKETHEFLRGSGTFEKTVHGIELLVKHGLRVKSSTALSRINIGEIDLLLHFGREIGLSEMYFNSMLPSGAGKTIQDHVVNIDDWRIVQSELKEWNAKRQRPKAFAEHFFLFDNYRCVSNKSAFCYTGCKAGKRELIITPDGYIAVCPMVATEREYQTMSIRQYSLAEIWQSDPWVLKLRNITVETLWPVCQDCAYSVMCVGGCHLLALWHCGQLNAADPRCPYSKEGGDDYE